MISALNKGTLGENTFMSVNNPRLEFIPAGKSGQELQTAGHITSGKKNECTTPSLHSCGEMTFVDMSSLSEILLMLYLYSYND